MSTQRRIVEAIDGLLGTVSFHGNSVVRRRRGDGAYTNGDATDELAPILLDGDPCSRRRHNKLRGDKRCTGCGRTRNEIELDG